MCALLLVGLAALVPSGAAAAGPHPVLSATGGDELVPGFKWGVRTYAARCGDDGLALAVAAAPGWKVAVGDDPARAGDFDAMADIASGEGTEIEFRERGGERRTAFVRCMPQDMVLPAFERFRKGGPSLFAIQTPPTYGVVMSRAGAPVWWLRSSAFPFDTEIYKDRTMAWNQGGQEGNVDFGILEFRTLTGRIIRTVTPPEGGYTDVHDHLVLPNGNELIGVPTYEDGVDISAYGGSTEARVRNTAIEEVTPDGDLVRRWDSEDHIGLDETVDPWWGPVAAGNPADVSHWNAIDVVGKYMYLSFRHLDAIYKVNRKTGKIIWKLGGTETNKSLEIRGDPRKPQHFNGQHDVNVLRDGTITFFDNSTAYGGRPRALRFKINEDRGVARMIDEVKDPEVTVSGAGGSARLTHGDWLINWGVSNPGRVGAYDDQGRPIFRLIYPVGAAYRANPVPGAVNFKDLWRAMNRMSG